MDLSCFTCRVKPYRNQCRGLFQSIPQKTFPVFRRYININMCVYWAMCMARLFNCMYFKLSSTCYQVVHELDHIYFYCGSVIFRCWSTVSKIWLQTFFIHEWKF